VWLCRFDSYTIFLQCCYICNSYSKTVSVKIILDLNSIDYKYVDVQC